jgi:hypothetical protein
LSPERLRAIFVARGFALVPQDNGTPDLPANIYEALLDVVTEARNDCAKLADARRPLLLEQAARHRFGSPQYEALRARALEAREIGEAIRSGHDAQQVLAHVPRPQWRST